MKNERKIPAPQGDIAELLLIKTGLRLRKSSADSRFHGEMECAEIDSNGQPLPSGHRHQLCLALLEAWCAERKARLGWRPAPLLFEGQEADVVDGGSDGRLLDLLVERGQRLLETCREHGEQHHNLQTWGVKVRESADQPGFPDSREKLAGIVSELEESLALLARLKSGCPLDAIQGAMESLFGAALIDGVVKDFVLRYGKSVEDGKSRHYRHGGRLCIPGIGGGMASGSEPTLSHTHYGNEVRHGLPDTRIEELSPGMQIKCMSKQWPDFAVLRNRTRADRVWWDGMIKPLDQSYRLQVHMRCGRSVRREKDVPYPRISVIQPLLRRRRQDPDEPIPHIYHNRRNPELPFLCLFYPPNSEEYAASRRVSDVIPWAIDWLACYEGWLATGEWSGGGIHPQPSDENLGGLFGQVRQLSVIPGYVCGLALRENRRIMRACGYQVD